MEENIREIYKIAKFKFEKKEDYLAGQRDLEKIARLGVEKKMDYASVSAIVKRIEDEEIVFESVVGEEFLCSLSHRMNTYYRRIARRLMSALCYAVIAGGITFFVVSAGLEYKNAQILDDLRERVEQEERLLAMQERDPSFVDVSGYTDEGNRTEADYDTMDMWQSEETGYILPQYADIYAENSYFIGWLKIEGTGIDYPVMQGPDNEYYLTKNIQNTYDKNGTLILDVGCKTQDPNGQYLIYGHNVQSGRMFGELLNYKDPAYWGFHPTILFDSLTKEGEYEIVSVFLVSMEDGKALSDFYRYKTFEDEKDYEEYIDLIKENSLYDTGVVPAYGSPLLTLVTCDNSVKDGRLVVVAGEVTVK